MQEQKYVVLHNRGYGLNAYECETQQEAIDKMAELVRCGEPISSVKLLQEIPTKTKVKAVSIEVGQ
ncbi:hypothetical protein OCB72_28935 [Bacillus cereus]|nr:hypothetical protein [Bacillus cereus]